MFKQIENVIQKDLIFMIRYGSHNYNLNTLESDFDYRGFISHHDEQTINFGFDNYDICINGLNQLHQGILTMDPRFLEVLFPYEIVIKKNFSFIFALINMRNQIITMDLYRFYMAHLYKYKLHRQFILNNKNPSKNIEYEIHSYRFLKILEKFYLNEFTDYQQALRFDDSEEDKYIILQIKQGRCPPSVLDIENKYLQILKLEKYYTQPPQLDIINYTNELFNKMLI
jgi:hypothetical protein